VVIQHRGAAPNLFVEELADAIAVLTMEAGVGVWFLVTAACSAPRVH
jgi:hypothetical protein